MSVSRRRAGRERAGPTIGRRVARIKDEARRIAVNIAKLPKLACKS
jgi:hypothetical protein